MKTKKRNKIRLYGKDHPRMPKPVSTNRDKKSGFSLRTIREADSRFAVVKALRKRLDQIIEDTGADTLARQILAARAAFISGYLESLETDALEGKEIDWKRYLQAVKSVSDVLSKLGLNKEATSTISLAQHVEEKYGDGRKRK